MLSDTLVELSRWQFALTAMLHFLFIPLTLGLSLMLAILESAHVLSGRGVYRDMIAFWRPIFAINFLLAFATRLAVILQFGMNGSYFSHYVGDALALPLAIEAMTSFFLASALFGPYWFGRDKLGKSAHLLLIWLIALAVHASAFWIMLANAWMQNPVGAAFNPFSYRLELTDFMALFENPIAKGKFIHTLAASHATAAAATIAIAGYRLRKNGNDMVALRGFNHGAIWGLLALAVTVAVKDDTCRLDQPVQKAKFAAIDGVGDATLQAALESHIRNGKTAFELLEKIRDDNRDPQLLANFDSVKADLGYGLLLKPFSKQIIDAQDKHIKRAAQTALPGYPKLLYWLNRLMIACGVAGLLWFAWLSWRALQRRTPPSWLLLANPYLAFLPWLACIAGWFVAEAGKQPWAIAGVLPISQATSSLSVKELVISLFGHAAIYGVMLTAAALLLKQAIVNPNTVETGDPS